MKLSGWVHRRRDHGHLAFFDLRDRYGLTQVVTNQEEAPEAHAAAEPARSEWVVQVEGVVRERRRAPPTLSWRRARSRWRWIGSPS